LILKIKCNLKLSLVNIIMSDDDYYSEPDSENSDEDNIVSSSNKKLPIKLNIAKFGDDEDDDAEPDDAEQMDDNSDDEDDDGIVGGADSDIEEGEIKEDDEDDADPEEEVEDDDDSDSDIEINEDGEPVEKVASLKNTANPSKFKKAPLIMNDDDDDEDDEYDESYLHKFDNEIIKNYVNDFHPECLNHNYDEIAKLSVVTRNPDGIIIDPLHRTIPVLTKYEKARILGQRAKQIETGAKPLVKVPETIVDAYIIAELELKEKKIPFIIRRPIPGGGSEYWNLKDLENIAF
jgi:DNA-directed RNA polymerase I, II, and III subunit RPABC2